MKKSIYCVRDEVAIDNSVIVTADSNQLMERNVKALLLELKPNYINQNTKDKRIFLIGYLDTSTGIIEALNPIQPLKMVEEIRLNLIDEINLEKAKIIASKEAAAKQVGIDPVKLDEGEVSNA